MEETNTEFQICEFVQFNNGKGSLAKKRDWTDSNLFLCCVIREKNDNFELTPIITAEIM